MKKILISAVIALSLAACGNNETEKNQAPATTQKESKDYKPMNYKWVDDDASGAK